MEIVILKSLLKRYNKEKTLGNWILLEDFIEDKSYCQDCGGSIFYPTSTMNISREGDLRYNTNFPCSRSFKEVEGKKYFLRSCPSCLDKKFKEYSSMNKSRVFNVMNRITRYAFKIPDDVAKRFTKTTAVTLENLIKKYGEDKGRERWDRYRHLQSITNKFEYKKEKYGWTKEDFKKFNVSRGITLQNMIKKHGEEKGRKVFEDYVEKQRINGKTLEYFIEKLGDFKGRIRYKEISIGKAKGSLISGSSYSKVSRDLFDRLDMYFGNIYETFYASKNYEKIIYIDSISKCYLLDYYIKDINVCIEFNGNYYHANPNKYPPDFSFPEFSTDSNIMTSKDLWEKDERKINFLKESGIKTIVVWESDYYKNKDNEEFYKKIIRQCIEK